MKYNFSQFRLVDVIPEENTVVTVLSGDITLLCTLHYDNDPVSTTFERWICVLEVVTDEENIPERSFVLYPGTIHFEGDNTYIVGVASEFEQITRDNIDSVYLTIGVPVNE